MTVELCTPHFALWVSVCDTSSAFYLRWGVSSPYQPVLHCNYSVSVALRASKGLRMMKSAQAISHADYSGCVCVIKVWMSDWMGHLWIVEVFYKPECEILNTRCRCTKRGLSPHAGMVSIQKSVAQQCLCLSLRPLSAAFRPFHTCRQSMAIQGNLHCQLRSEQQLKEIQGKQSHILLSASYPISLTVALYQMETSHSSNSLIALWAPRPTSSFFVIFHWVLWKPLVLRYRQLLGCLLPHLICHCHDLCEKTQVRYIPECCKMSE